MTNFFRNISAKLKSFFRKLFPLVFFQLSDKLDFTWTKSKKGIIEKIVFAIAKFIIIMTLIAVIIWILCAFLKIISVVEIVNLYIVFFTAIMLLMLLSNTHHLMLSLYYAEDNKLLVTFPVSSTTLFFSKILNFLIFDFIKNLGLLIPVTFGFAIGGILVGEIQAVTLAWMLIPLLFTNAIIVLVASLLSVPYLYIYRFFKTYPIAELLTFLIAAAGIIVLVTYSITLIPEDINLVGAGGQIIDAIENAIINLCDIFPPIKYSVNAMFGVSKNTFIGYKLLADSFAYFGIIVAIFVGLVVVCYFVIKPFFFHVMTKSLEFDKGIIDEPKPNKKRTKYLTFINKEVILSIRDIDISGSFLLVYILAPILLYFIDSVFSAISTNLGGDIMTYAFNILLMLVPFLASNSVVATLYSREGRAAYMKKTKPMSLIFPLSSKLLIYIVFSIISIISCGIVFADYSSGTDLGILCPTLLTFTVIFLQIAHMYYSATLDIMNPQNEAYATTGGTENNQNENLSTAVAFIGSMIFAFVAYLLMTESHLYYGDYVSAFVKLLIIAIVAAASCFYLFVMKVKAYYYEK